MVLGNDVDLKALARITAGMTGADLYNLINIAAVRCSAEDKPSISMEALESALDRSTPYFMIIHRTCMLHNHCICLE